MCRKFIDGREGLGLRVSAAWIWKRNRGDYRIRKRKTPVSPSVKDLGVTGVFGFNKFFWVSFFYFQGIILLRKEANLIPENETGTPLFI